MGVASHQANEKALTAKRNVVIPALPYRHPIYKPQIALSKEEMKDHYTRLQILTRTNGYCLPDTRCMLDEITESRTANDAYKLLSVSEFIAVCLVRTSTLDVVAVTLDQISSSKIKITVARNETTEEDVAQVDELKSLFCRHFIREPQNCTSQEEFRLDFLRTVLKWGASRLETRLTILNHPGAHSQGAKSAATAEKLITIDKINTAFENMSKDESKVKLIRELRNRYVAVEKKVYAESNETSLLRGDQFLIKHALECKKSLITAAHSFLASIKMSITRFYKARRKNVAFDVNDLATMLTAADTLGTSRVFEDLLDLACLWSAASRFQFCRSLRKLGVYRYGVNMLYSSMTTCRGGKSRTLN
jgi:hypothetical protein